MRILVICLFLLPPSFQIQAQGLGSLLGGKSQPASTSADDPLGRETPRRAIRAFLEACHDQKYLQASRYLDLQNLTPKQRFTQGPELARQLADILDRDAEFELGRLSDAAAGDSNDGLQAGKDKLVGVQMDGAYVNLYLQHEPENGKEVWLVSQDSVAKLHRLSAFSEETPFEQKLPSALVANRFLGTSLWVWFALVLSAMVLSLASRLLSRLVIAIVKPIARRYAKSLHTYRLEAFTEPVRLLVTVSVFRAVIEFLDPSALLRDYLLKLLTLLFALGAASLVMRIIDLVFDQVQTRMDPRQRSLTYSVLPLGVRVIKVIVICIFVLLTLSGWGFNTNTILAGVGVGGLAVALAAQKTIENFFGGVSLISDRPVLVGDFCQFGGQVGTIEDIGLRSTRIRTLDRTLVTIPNAQFSTMTLENYSRRDRMWFHPTLKLRRGTTAEDVERFMSRIAELLKSEPQISIGSVPLRFTKIDEQALNIEVFAYVLSDNFDDFLKVQSKMLLQFLKAGDELGIRFAIPIVESLTGTLTPGAAAQVAAS